MLLCFDLDFNNPHLCTNLLKQVISQVTMTDQACGCEADSGDPDYSCDCAMQGACICSADCKCATDVCKEAVSQMS